jgi:hypothetical protein
VSQVLLRFTAASLTTSPPDQGASPRFEPETAADNAQRLQLKGPLTVEAGGTLSLLVPIRLGVDAVVTRNGLLRLSPTLSANVFSPAPTAMTEAWGCNATGLRPDPKTSPTKS